MSEEMLVKYCSPTLAGMKTANMFSCSYSGEGELYEFIRRVNQTLSKKGLRILSLKMRDGRALIYVYRPRRLERDLEHSAAASLLRERNYSLGSLDSCITELIRRLRMGDEFPHEIGLFLGYPPEDVRGFIENRAEGAKCSGAWKVYGDSRYAEKVFAEYKKCTDIFCAQFAKGIPIDWLAVAETGI